MRAFMAIVCTVACLAVLGCAQAEPPEEEEKAGSPALRLGTYDSRAIAVAYGGSSFCRDYLKGLRARHTEAKAAGDKRRMADAEAEAKAQQRRLHRQGFSTAPVDDLLAHIKDRLPEIMAEAGVDKIASKWDKEALAKHKAAERKDITMPLIQAFSPNERALKMATSIQKDDPIPLKKLDRILDKGHH